MDPILTAGRLPRLAQTAMRRAIVSAAARRASGDGRRVTQRGLVDDALLAFEAAVARVAKDGVRPALLFAERDRIVTDLRRFLKTRLAARLFSLPQRDAVTAGRAAAPFDAIVRGKRGGDYAVVFRRLPADGSRLEAMRAMRTAAYAHARAPRGILVYDFVTGRVRTLRCGERPIELSAA